MQQDRDGPGKSCDKGPVKKVKSVMKRVVEKSTQKVVQGARRTARARKARVKGKGMAHREPVPLVVRARTPA